MNIKELAVTGLTVAIGETALQNIVPEGLAGAGVEIGGAMAGEKHLKGELKGIAYGVGILGIIKAFQLISGAGGLIGASESAIGSVI